MTAQNLIEILQACANNTGQSLEEMEVIIEDSNGYILPIGSYYVDNPFVDEGFFCVLKEGDEW